MTDEEREEMKRYGVTAKQETVYLLNGAKYRLLKDALNQAKLVASRESESMASGGTKATAR